TKELIKKEVEEMFGVKVDKIRTLVRGNKKYAYVKLNEKFLAIDVATKLGLM
ncbi:MAG: 50S ribosomal protein L23, partial [Nanoarchaeota archaeon]|nr:50S ribosomal protein L23 [Nanoarchaeota archaeon]